MPTINFDIRLYDNGYGEHMGKGQIAAVMVFPTDKAMRDRYWKAVSRDYLKAKIFALDQWPVTLGEWEFRALATGEGLEEHFIEAKENAKQSGWLAAQCLRFILRAKAAGRPEDGSINKWVYFVDELKGLRIPWRDKPYKSKPTLLGALHGFASVAHLWAALLNDDGTEKNISTDWDDFIAEARWFQQQSNNLKLLIANSKTVKDDDIWLLPDGPDNATKERPIGTFTAGEIAILDKYRAY